MLSNQAISLGRGRHGTTNRGVKPHGLQSNDENAVRLAKNNGDAAAVNKTPSAKTTRRAFGDISNRGASGTAAKAVSFRSHTPATTKLIVKNTLQKTPFQSKQDKKSANSERRVKFDIPEESSRLDALFKQSKRVFQPTPRTKVRVTEREDSWFLEEPEKPAGMLFSEQLEAWDLDGETVLSLEGVSSFKRRMMDASTQASHVAYLEGETNDKAQLLLELDRDIEEFNRNCQDEFPPPPVEVDPEVMVFFDTLDSQLSISDSFSEHQVNISFG